MPGVGLQNPNGTQAPAWRQSGTRAAAVTDVKTDVAERVWPQGLQQFYHSSISEWR